MSLLEEIIINTLIDTGIITFIIPSLLFMAMTYVFLLRSKIIESKFISFIISFSIFLLIMVFPIISGINISIFLSTFFVQIFFILLIFLIGLISASIFYPDFLKVLERFQRSRSMIMLMIIISAIIFIISGMLSFLIGTLGGPPITNKFGEERIRFPMEVSFTITLLILLIVFSALLLAAGRIALREI